MCVLSRAARPLSGGATNESRLRQRALPPFNARWRRVPQKISAPLSGADCLKMSPNFVIQAAPNGKSRFFGRGGPLETQFHGGFLADDVEVRRAERGIKPNGKINRIPFSFIANFLLFAEGKTSKFPIKESDNFCPKAKRIQFATLLEIGVGLRWTQIWQIARVFVAIKLQLQRSNSVQIRANDFVSKRVALLGFIS